jgi:hypothetical protein
MSAAERPRCGDRPGFVGRPGRTVRGWFTCNRETNTVRGRGRGSWTSCRELLGRRERSTPPSKAASLARAGAAETEGDPNLANRNGDAPKCAGILAS